MKSKLVALAALTAVTASPLVMAADTDVTLYGFADLSVDYANNGLSGRAGAMGNNGWLGAVSSNLSRLGVKGSRDLGNDMKGVFQFETQVDVSATPGNSATDDGAVKGALASRNSFLGLAGSWGAAKLGKTDAPYKLSTARMDPFSGTLGDYNSIIGNTGGDNRAEFDTRLSHAAWYESPAAGHVQFSALVSPGQNRFSANSGMAKGEPDCTGGNSGPDCTDGSFGTAWSAAATYSQGPVYGIVAYELHKGVNRTGDEGALPATAPAGSVGTADEKALKIGVQYKLGMTVINAIYEDLRRSAPNPNFNERQHKAGWLAVTQQVTSQDDVNVGWAHAGKTPGDPGSELRTGIDPSTGGTSIAGPVDNAANMFAAGYKHHFADKKTTWYAVYAEQKNHAGAHYDLGASGHGITVDCQDAISPGGGHNCFGGTTIKAATIGMTYDF